MPRLLCGRAGSEAPAGEPRARTSERRPRGPARGGIIFKRCLPAASHTQKKLIKLAKLGKGENIKPSIQLSWLAKEIEEAKTKGAGAAPAKKANKEGHSSSREHISVS